MLFPACSFPLGDSVALSDTPLYHVSFGIPEGGLSSDTNEAPYYADVQELLNDLVIVCGADLGTRPDIRAACLKVLERLLNASAIEQK